jgi:nucleoside-diphosphate-sugar epimerase
MRLLVTGAAGFMGRNALLTLPAQWKIVALYRPGNRDFLAFLERHKLGHVQAIACDLTHKQQVRQAMEQVGGDFDTCLALASNTSIPRSIEQPLYDLMINVVGLLHILDSCTFKHLVYLSSGAVYLGASGLVGPLTPVAPCLPYAISKLAAEQYIRAYVQQQTRLEAATIVRFFGAYGPYEPERKLYTKLVRRFAFERNPHFTLTGDGENYIDAMYVDDAIQALLMVITHPTPDAVCCIDLGVGGRESVKQVITRAAHVFGLEAQIHCEGATAEYIEFTIDPQSFASRYQFVPSIALELGLTRLATHLAHEGGNSHG